MTALYDVAAIGNAIVDVIAPAEEAFLSAEGLSKGSMQLIDEARGIDLYSRMSAGIETSGGSAGNTIAGIASLGGKAAYMGKVSGDQLGEVFAHDMRSIGVHFETPPLAEGPATARCLINVTPDGQRTMCTYLGASTELTAHDVPIEMIEQSAIVYLEGYLFDPSEARRAFAKAAALAHGAGRMIAITLSDAFVVERHRGELLGFVQDQADLVFANEVEVKALFETDDFELAAAKLGAITRVCAITRGEQGSLILAGDQSHRIAAHPVGKVVDTTGAGDQYAAGFMFGLARGLNFDVCGELGSMAAAEVISHYGPRPLTSLKQLAIARGLLT